MVRLVLKSQFEFLSNPYDSTSVLSLWVMVFAGIFNNIPLYVVSECHVIDNSL